MTETLLAPVLWSEECLESERKFQKRIARLYPLQDEKVNTPKGPGVLVHTVYRPRVLLDREVARAKRAKPTGSLQVPGRGKAPRTHDFDVEEIWPIQQ